MKIYTKNDIGIKAYSLLKLKEAGLFPENLLIEKNLISKAELIKKLVQSNFNKNIRMFVRFSHPNTSIKLPKGTFDNFDDLHQFIVANYQPELTIIIHDFIQGAYGGTITLVGDKLVVEFIEGGWNAYYSLNSDTAIFDTDSATFLLFQNLRQVPYVEGTQIKTRSIQPLAHEKSTVIFQEIKNKLPQIKSLLSDEFNSLEFLFDKDLNFKPIELQNLNINQTSLLSKINPTKYPPLHAPIPPSIIQGDPPTYEAYTYFTKCYN